MCGIAGALFPPGTMGPQALTELTIKMADTLVHRGPDSRGHWTDPAAGVALGHTRLEVVGLGEAGHQPMLSADERWVLAYNGELYNAPELRRRIESADTRLRGGSDTELLVEASARWGPHAALERMQGMYAFALWDRRERLLYLARDPLGEKPLYFMEVAGGVAFASELRGLRRLPNARLEIDRGSLALLLRDACIPAPRTIYSQVEKLEPGSIIEAQINRGGLRLERRRYWQLDPGAVGIAQTGSEELVTSTEERLMQSVGARLVSDVPLGAFLSGGIDSSLVVALMQKRSDRPVKTFTLGFDAPGYDEAPRAKAISEFLGTDHTEVYVSPDSARQVIPELPDIYDEPFADASQIPTVLVSRIARADVSVCLSGDGGDEVFAGYNRYGLLPRLRELASRLGRAQAILPLVRALPATGLDGALRLLERFLPHRLRPLPRGESLHKLMDVIGRPDNELYAALTAQWQDPRKVVVEAPSPIIDPWLSRPEAEGFEDPVQRMRYLDINGYLPDDILVKLDRASMSVGLEARAPFLDPELVRFAWQIPLQEHVSNGVGKQLLRRILSRHLPTELFERSKTGFATPIDAWLRGPLREWAEDLLAHDRLRRQGWLRPEPVQAYWHEHLSGRRNWQYPLWTVLMFQAWFDRWG